MRLCAPSPVSRLLALLTLSAASPALAQQDRGFDAHGFQLAAHDSDVRDPLVLQRPGAFSQADFFMGFVGEYARAPLVQVTGAELSDQEFRVPVLDHLVVTNLSAGVAVHERLRIDLAAPVYLAAYDGVADEVVSPAPGDLRATAMLVLVRPEHVEVGGGGPGLALVGHVDAPTGVPEDYLGQPGVAGGADLAATYELGRATFSADIGAQFNPSVNLANIRGADSLLAGLAIGVLPSDVVGLTAELVARPPFAAVDRVSLPAEGVLHLRYVDRSTGTFWTMGGAAGLTSGPGVASFRAFLGGGIGRAKAPRPPTLDALGSFQVRDQCPMEAEVENGWQDDDGCPDELGQLAIEVRWQDLPFEADATLTGPEGTEEVAIGPEGLQRDAVPGSKWSIDAQTGQCLEGSGEITVEEGGSVLSVELQQQLQASVRIEVVGEEDEPIADAFARWTGEAPCLPLEDVAATFEGVITHPIGVGTHTLEVRAPGRKVYTEPLGFQAGDERVLRVALEKARVYVADDRIEVYEKVAFDEGSARMGRATGGLLDEVAAAILAHPEAGVIEIGAHTDSSGTDEQNQRLTERRAQAVLDHLVQAGVPSDRLLAVGYGETLPLDTNRTPQGRERNRRVEFLFVAKKTPTPEGAP